MNTRGRKFPSTSRKCRDLVIRTKRPLRTSRDGASLQQMTEADTR
jgi:hypothetical protein